MWVDQPQTEGGRPIVPLLRCRAGGKIERRLTGEPMRCFIHYACGRSWPCTGQSCWLCKMGVGKRFYSYYPVTNSEGAVAILEMTAQVENSLIEQMSPVTQVPRGMVTIKRDPGKANNPCSIAWQDYNPTELKSFKQLEQKELKRCLMRIWKLPELNGEQEDYEYLERINKAIAYHCRSLNKTEKRS